MPTRRSGPGSKPSTGKGSASSKPGRPAAPKPQPVPGVIRLKPKVKPEPIPGPR
jgi:hypothetical protein